MPMIMRDQTTVDVSDRDMAAYRIEDAQAHSETNHEAGATDINSDHPEPSGCLDRVRLSCPQWSCFLVRLAACLWHLYRIGTSI